MSYAIFEKRQYDETLQILTWKRTHTSSSPPPPPPPSPPPRKGEGLTPLPSAQGSGGLTSFEPSQETVSLQHPFTLQAMGCTCSRKTCWMDSLLERARIMIKPSPERIIWCYKRWQPFFSEMQRNINNIIFMQGIPENLNPNNSKKFMVKHMEATKRPFGYLLIDLKQNTSDDQGLKTDIFEGFVRKKYVYSNINQSSDLSTFPMVGEGNSGRTVNYKRENSTEIHQSDNNPQSVNMEKQNPSCIDCETLFSIPFDVQRHIKRGCPMDENASVLSGEESILF